MAKKYVRLLVAALILYAPGLIFFATTSPENLPVGLYIIPFVYVFGCVYLTTRFLLRRSGHHTDTTRLLPNVVAVLVTLVLLLGSLRQLSVRDVLLIGIIGVLLVWYIRKLQAQS